MNEMRENENYYLNNKTPRNPKLGIGDIMRSFFEETAKGVTALGESVQKSGLLPHLIFFWCIVWGFIGIFITLALLFG